MLPVSFWTEINLNYENLANLKIKTFPTNKDF